MAGDIAKGIANGIDDIINGGAGGIHVCATCHEKGKCN